MLLSTYFFFLQAWFRTTNTEIHRFRFRRNIILLFFLNLCSTRYKRINWEGPKETRQTRMTFVKETLSLLKQAQRRWHELWVYAGVWCSDRSRNKLSKFQVKIITTFCLEKYKNKQISLKFRNILFSLLFSLSLLSSFIYIYKGAIRGEGGAVLLPIHQVNKCFFFDNYFYHNKALGNIT